MNTRHRYLVGLAAAMGCDPSIIDKLGVTVTADPDRAENHVTAGYALGRHLVVTCDPAAEGLLVEACSSMEPSLDAWRARAVESGGEYLGEARMQVVPTHDFPQIVLPAGYSLRELDRSLEPDRALIEELVSTSAEDDLEEIELSLDDLEPTICAVLDDRGKIAAFADAHPWEMVSDFGDIGVLTRPDSRGKDLGKAAVVALCDRLIEAGFEPVYRCDEDNVGSIKLSAALGFEIATQLVAYRFPAM